MDSLLRGIKMLQLRPTCENCNKPLPPDSCEAMICSYECTFCQHCVDTVLENVCPNCGGGFCKRPIRPSQNLEDDNYLGNDPASAKAIYKPVNTEIHNAFAMNIKGMPAHKR